MEYVHGGDVYTAAARRGREIGAMLDFSANLNPLGMPPRVAGALHDAVAQSWRYPDPQCAALREALSRWERVPPDWIFCANGAAEAIFRLAQAIKPRRALVPAPTFAEYEAALRSADSRVDYGFLSREKGFMPDENFLEQITPETDMVFFCNPNNPTGYAAPYEYMSELTRRCALADTWLAVDECFLDFWPEGEACSVKGLLKKYPKLVVLRAFTKIFAMAGVRLGYCLTANPRLRGALEAQGQPWSVSVFAQYAGVAAVEAGLNTTYIARTHALVAQERERLVRALEGKGFAVFKGRANYILFSTPRLDLRERLEERGILIRDCSNYVGLLPGDFRIAVRSPEENRQFCKALEDL